MDARIYLRVSTEEQAQSGYSLSAQRERLEAFCKSQGWTIAGIYVEDGVSGKDLNRPEFQRMMSEILQGDVVLVYKLDRLTRSVSDLDKLLKTFEAKGILFKSATEQFNTTEASGRLFIRMVAEFAQFEREIIAERASMGKRERSLDGEWAGGQVPFGYVAVPSGNMKRGRNLLRVIPDANTAHLVKMIFGRYLSGYGMRAICLWLNDELGVRTVRGGRWTVATIRNLLTNRFYIGDIEYKRHQAGYTVTHGHHEPIITPEAFQRVQEMFAGRKESAPRHATGEHTLAGIARCGVCGGAIYGRRRSPGRQRYYRCRNHIVGLGCGDGASKPLSSVSAELAEQRFLSEIEKRLVPPDDLERFLSDYEQARAHRSGMGQAEIARLKDDLAESDASIQRWRKAYEKGSIDHEEFAAYTKPHRERIRTLKARLAEVEEQQRSMPSHATLRASTVSITTEWPWMTPQERKVVVTEFTKHFGFAVLLYPDRRVELKAALV